MRKMNRILSAVLIHDEDFYGSIIQQRELLAQGEKGVKHDIDYSGRSMSFLGKFLRLAK
jgi:hypothetical protein